MKDIRKVGSIGWKMVVYYMCTIAYAVVIYFTTVKTMAGLGPLAFFKGMTPAMMMAFSSASSVGTLPLNLDCAEKLGADKDVASFVLPLGATINMDGTAIYQGVCAVFIASCYGINLTLSQMLTIVLTATLASIGTAGVDRIFDMGRTTVNITGDAACSIIVSKLEAKKEQRKRNA